MQAKPGRIAALDLARTVALFAMASYHFGYDLEAFGYLPPGTMLSGWPAIYARCIASSFLFLVGVGLYLGHGAGVRWRPFGRRLAMILAGAAVVSLATRYAEGPYYVFFGILHSIALSSLIGLAFLRLPAGLTLIVALAAFLAPHYLRAPLFDAPWLWWLGLTTGPVESVDYIPTLPWLAPVLAGIAMAKVAAKAGVWRRLSGVGQGFPWLTWPGRHSLLVYLIHQPILVGLVFGYGWLTGK